MRWFFGFQEKKPISFSCAKYVCYGLEGWDYSLSIVHHGKISFSIHIKKDIVQPRSISFIEIYPAARNLLPPSSNVFNGGSFTEVCTRLHCTLTVWHGYMAMLYIVGIHWLESFFSRRVKEIRRDVSIDRTDKKCTLFLQTNRSYLIVTFAVSKTLFLCFLLHLHR